MVVCLLALFFSLPESGRYVASSWNLNQRSLLFWLVQCFYLYLYFELENSARGETREMMILGVSITDRNVNCIASLDQQVSSEYTYSKHLPIIELGSILLRLLYSDENFDQHTFLIVPLDSIQMFELYFNVTKTIPHNFKRQCQTRQPIGMHPPEQNRLLWHPLSKEPRIKRTCNASTHLEPSQ